MSVSARDALDFAVESENLVLYALVAVGWFLAFAIDIGDLIGILRTVSPELHSIVGGFLGLVFTLGGLFAVTGGLVALAYRAAAEAP